VFIYTLFITGHFQDIKIITLKKEGVGFARKYR